MKRVRYVSCWYVKTHRDGGKRFLYLNEEMTHKKIVTLPGYRTEKFRQLSMQVKMQVGQLTVQNSARFRGSEREKVL